MDLRTKFPKEQRVYECSDGEKFDSLDDANKHEQELSDGTWNLKKVFFYVVEQKQEALQVMKDEDGLESKAQDPIRFEHHSARSYLCQEIIDMINGMLSAKEKTNE